ncbi:uncharacterized protein LOC141874022 isoform X1 [Acropora palmata]|uniref:uncharacterized protein LOC141874022 isoform X1 n=1 Tax=Acropora palmata TaxID=6131 RepID=UPI003DA081B9
MAFSVKSVLQQRSFDLSDAVEETSKPVFQRLACGLGHTLNDLTTQLLFSFRLVLFMNVLGLSAENAGWLVLQKQLVHVVMAPICAMLVDRVYIPLVSRKYGKKKSWHLIGTFLQTVFIPLFFAAHYLIQNDNGQTEQMMLIYFGILNVILGFGDSMLDISHLSLISVVAKDQIEAVELSALRTALTYLSGILTFVVSWVILGQGSKSQLSANSSKDFTVLTAILVAVGVLLSLIFHVGTKEPSSSPRMPLRKLSTLAATNLARLTSFSPSGGLGEPMPSLATGLIVVRKLSRPSRKASRTRVSFGDGMRWTPRKCDESEEKMAPKEMPKSSPLSPDPNSIGVFNEGFYVSVLDLYSDDESNDTSRVVKEPVPITKVTDVSVENESALLSKTETSNQPIINSGSNTSRKDSVPSKKTSRVTFSEEILLSKKFATNETQTFKEVEPPKENPQSWSSSLSNDSNSTGVVNKELSVSVLDLPSDDESNDTGRVSEEPVPIIKLSAVSLETECAQLNNSRANELNTTEKKSCPSRKKAFVSFCDGIQPTSAKYNPNDEQMLFNEKEPSKDYLQPWSSSLSDDPNCTEDVINRNLPVRVLDLYSDDRSDDTSRVCKEQAAINISSVSPEITSDSLSESNANSKPVVDSGGPEVPPPRLISEKTVRDWVFDPRLYIVAIAYSCSWTLQSHGYSYLPLLLIYRLRLSKDSIAYLPLIMSISAAVSSFLSKKFVQKIGNKLCFIFAAISVSSSGVMTYFMEPESSEKLIYPAVILLGFGFSLMHVNSLNFGTELIGDNKKTSGFVFGCMSLTGYAVVGPLFIIIQTLFPEERGTDCIGCGEYLRLVFSSVTIVFSTLGAFLVLLLYCIDRFQGKCSSTCEDPDASK